MPAAGCPICSCQRKRDKRAAPQNHAATCQKLGLYGEGVDRDLRSYSAATRTLGTSHRGNEGIGAPSEPNSCAIKPHPSSERSPRG